MKQAQKAFFLLHISSLSRSLCLTGVEWEADRCLTLIIVLRESVFHVSDILDDNSFGQIGWKITFLRLPPAAALIRRWRLVPLHSITLQFEACPFGEEGKNISGFHIILFLSHLP